MLETAILWSLVTVTAIAAIYFLWVRKLGRKNPEPHLPNRPTVINS